MENKRPTPFSRKGKMLLVSSKLPKAINDSNELPFQMIPEFETDLDMREFLKNAEIKSS